MWGKYCKRPVTLYGCRLSLLAAELEAAKRPRPLVVSPQVYERLRREWYGKEARR